VDRCAPTARVGQLTEFCERAFKLCSRGTRLSDSVLVCGGYLLTRLGSRQKHTVMPAHTCNLHVHCLT
jgi:hypothetical protein